MSFWKAPDRRGLSTKARVSAGAHLRRLHPAHRGHVLVVGRSSNIYADENYPSMYFILYYDLSAYH